MRTTVTRQEVVCDRCHSSVFIPKEAQPHTYNWYITPYNKDLCPTCCVHYEAVMKCLDAYMNSFTGTMHENEPADLLAGITAALKG